MPTEPDLMSSSTADIPGEKQALDTRASRSSLYLFLAFALLNVWEFFFRSTPGRYSDLLFALIATGLAIYQLRGLKRQPSLFALTGDELRFWSYGNPVRLKLSSIAHASFRRYAKPRWPFSHVGALTLTHNSGFGVTVINFREQDDLRQVEKWLHQHLPGKVRTLDEIS